MDSSSISVSVETILEVGLDVLACKNTSRLFY